METEGNSIVIATPLIVQPVDGNGTPTGSLLTPPINNRKDFPDGFVFGTGTGAYQVEGAAAKDGKGISVWDDFTLRTPNRIDDGSNGNIACDMYNRYKEDLRTMKNMGFDAYRFSISWTRILPSGRASGGINRAGIDYYNDLIDTVIKNGMKPYVTLFHWDTPLILEREYGGFLSKNIVADFRDYAELCFWEFGDRVQWWTTVNEPWTYTVHGYVKGTFPPSKASCSPDQAEKTVQSHRSAKRAPRTLSSTQSSSDVTYDKTDPKEAYTVARNLLLAHSEVVDLYRKNFKDIQHGEIGIVLNSHWHVPYDESSHDHTAVYRAVDFMLGWFLEPVLYGEYPKSMIENVPADNLAPFSIFEKEKLKGSVDFVGLNYYTTNYAKHDDNPKGTGYDADQHCEFPNWLFIVPWGIYEHLKYMVEKHHTHLPSVYITENGVSDKNDHDITAKVACNDPTRTQYHKDHLAYIRKAMTEYKGQGLDVKGYFVWSWCDNFEWAQGYTARFGITYIDYMNDQTRYPKDSAKWFVNFLKGPKKLLASSKKRQNEENDSENNGAEKRARINGEEE